MFVILENRDTHIPIYFSLTMLHWQLGTSVVICPHWLLRNEEEINILYICTKSHMESIFYASLYFRLFKMRGGQVLLVTFQFYFITIYKSRKLNRTNQAARKLHVLNWLLEVKNVKCVIDVRKILHAIVYEMYMRVFFFTSVYFRLFTM